MRCVVAQSCTCVSRRGGSAYVIQSVVLPCRYAGQLDFLSNVHMKWSILFLFLYRGFAVAAAAEEYREELTLRPLVDGKLSAHFSFSTLLPDAVPRDPSSLGTDDACT
jgi:hypothetical protein